ncbi:ATP-binding protein [Streptomyces sp. NPDC047000]|uniref:ATP-binding protein n=1 Tax=Streptomyces sp. NPDC047000 TaxID=3155474 RepID=UPI0033CEB3AE
MKSEISPAREHSSPAGCLFFRQQFSSTERGARLARLLAVQQLVDWGWDRDGEGVADAALVVAELSTNAVVHGRLPGRGFLLSLALTAAAGGASVSLRIEVADSRGELAPHPDTRNQPWDEHGRGLLIVQSLAARWGTVPRPPSGKTVWAVIDLADGGASRPGPVHSVPCVG